MFTLFLDQLNALSAFIYPLRAHVEVLKNSGLCRNQPKNVDLVSEKNFVVLGGFIRYNATIQYWRGFRCSVCVACSVCKSAIRYKHPKRTPVIQNYTHDE